MMQDRDGGLEGEKENGRKDVEKEKVRGRKAPAVAQSKK